jgi:3',5'-cyclic AMP phosphodiesterase CpdA
VRLAHFSDLHLLTLEGTRLLQFANKRWIGAMNLLSNRARHYVGDAFEDMIVDLNAQSLDHHLCTGDVTNLAFAQEFAHARALFDRLALGPHHVTVIPGNHDAYVAEGIDHFASTFADFHAADPEWRWPEGTSPWPIVRVRGDLALVGLTTSLATPWFTAYGRVGDEQLERTRSVLADPRLVGRARIVAIHHPVVGKRAQSRIRGLRDHAAFAQMIADAGADLIVHGHEHRDLRGALPGPDGHAIPVLGVPSGTYGAKDATRTARYRIITIENGRVVDHHLRVWNRDQKTFDRDPAEPAMAA